MEVPDQIKIAAWQKVLLNSLPHTPDHDTDRNLPNPTAVSHKREAAIVKEKTGSLSLLLILQSPLTSS